MTTRPVLLILDALAVYRLARLVTTDTLLQPLRDRIRAPWRIEHHGNATVANGRRQSGLRWWLAELVQCPWCMSVWFAAGVTILQATVPAVWLYASVWLALSAVAGALGEHV